MLKDALRSLKRTPGFALVVSLTLGLGIGTSVTTFTVMQGVLWKPLPYPGAERLVLLDGFSKTGNTRGIKPYEVTQLKAQSRTLDSIAVVSGVPANLNIDGELERVFAVSAHVEALTMLGADPPALGRLINDYTDFSADGFVNAVVISDALWRRHFGSDPSAIGRHIQVNNLNVQIVGVLRPGLKLFLPAATNTAEDPDVWFPRGHSEALDTSQSALARLAPGVTLAQANAELDTLGAAFAAAHPQHYAGNPRLFATSAQDVLTAHVKPALIALGVAVGFVLLISCVNVTNLLLARAKTREREITVRVALGAGRGRIIRQLLAEGAWLAVAGGGLGLALAFASVQLLDWLRPTNLPRQSQLGVDWTVTLFAVGLSGIVCVICGLIPALRITRREQLDPLRAGRSGTSAPGIRRLQRALVIAEVALSIVPLVGGGLMVRSFWNLTNAPLGFDPSGLVTARLQMSFRAVPDLDKRLALIRNAMNQVAELPGVEGVGAAGPLPMAFPNNRSFARENEAGTGTAVLASQQPVLPGYLGVTRTPLLQGRDISDEDLQVGRMVAVVDQRLALRLYPDGALGKRMHIKIGSNLALVEIVGITPPVRAARVSDADLPHVFLSYNIMQVEPWLVVRTAKTAATIGPEIRRVVEALGTTRPVVDIRPMQDYVDLSIGDTRFTMLMLTAFAAASLLLAGIGMYGTLAYLISQRTQEFGVRMALGATAGSVMGLVAREGALLAGMGAAAGMAVALGVAGTLRGLLYGVAPIDATTVIAVSLLIAAVATAAAGVPAWRAARVDPTTALRTD
ncbi:MAG: ADOP family duplicated permease [Vicinamibacterales bacterium]